MDEFYIMQSLCNAEEYMRIVFDTSEIKIPAIKAEYQFLDKSEITAGLSKDSGFEIPDFVTINGIHIISDYLKQILEKEMLDYIFYKKINLIDEKYGIHEKFWITVVPRIDCLDIKKSEVKCEWDFEDGLVPVLRAERIEIISKMVGRYKMFRIFGVEDNNIYITGGLYNKLIKKKIEDITYTKI